MFVNVTMSLNKIVTEANFSVRRENITFEQNIGTDSDNFLKKILEDINPCCETTDIPVLGFL